MLSPASLLNWGLRQLGCGPDRLCFWSQGLRMEELLHKKDEAEQEAYPRRLYGTLQSPRLDKTGPGLGCRWTLATWVVVLTGEPSSWSRKLPMPLGPRELNKIRIVWRVQNNPGLVPCRAQATQVTSGLAPSKRAARPMASLVLFASLKHWGSAAAARTGSRFLRSLVPQCSKRCLPAVQP